MKTTKKAWLLLAAYYQKEIPDEVLLMFITDLQDIPEEEILQAMQRWRLDPKNRTFPLPADLRVLARPVALTDDQIAVEVAGRIITAIGKFGWTSPEEAKTYCGEVGWAVVEKQGGWQLLCETLTTDRVNIFQAQLRELAKVQLVLSRLGKMYSPPELPASEVSEVVKMLAHGANLKNTKPRQG